MVAHIARRRSSPLLYTCKLVGRWLSPPLVRRAARGSRREGVLEADGRSGPASVVASSEFRVGIRRAPCAARTARLRCIRDALPVGRGSLRKRPVEHLESSCRSFDEGLSRKTDCARESLGIFRLGEDTDSVSSSLKVRHPRHVSAVDGLMRPFSHPIVVETTESPSRCSNRKLLHGVDQVSWTRSERRIRCPRWSE